MTETVLLTGGAGFIGSHTYIALIEAGYQVVILDNFVNSQPSVIDRLAQITGAPVVYERVDVLDQAALGDVFARHRPDAVVHFAALKSVSESVSRPLDYVRTNVTGLVMLLQVMQEADVFDLIFSSSATIYGQPEILPIPETAPRSYTNPYGYTKLAGEQILEQAAAADERWRFGILRYFNPAGAHDSGLIGEDPQETPNNLMPYIAKVAIGALPFLKVFGDDYPTSDGTGVRDFIHVMDLAEGHVRSLQALSRNGKGHVVNLGTGQGYSVMEMLAAYSRACGRDLPYEIRPRRSGDVAACYADPTLAADLLDFHAKRDLDLMCQSSWRWALASQK